MYPDNKPVCKDKQRYCSDTKSCKCPSPMYWGEHDQKCHYPAMPKVCNIVSLPSLFIPRSSYGKLTTISLNVRGGKSLIAVNLRTSTADMEN